MPRISAEQHASQRRIADLTFSIGQAVTATVLNSEHGDVTYEEVLAALLEVSSRQVRHLIADDNDDDQDGLRHTSPAGGSSSRP